MQFEQVPLTERGQNANISGYVPSDEVMEANGFHKQRDAFSAQEYWSKYVLMVYKTLELGFYVRMDLDGSHVQIDMIDEDFGQPYYWQMMDEGFDYAEQCKNFYWREMEKLVDAGILSGWKCGDY